MKLARLFVLTLLYIVCWFFLNNIIPFMCWVFGGSFLEVAQHPAYIVFISIFGINTTLGAAFYEYIDEDFYFKD